MSKNAAAPTVERSCTSTTKKNARTTKRRRASNGSTSAPTAEPVKKARSKSLKSTVSNLAHPDVCDKCRRRSPRYRVQIRIYHLEDLPLRFYYFDLCDPCVRLINRNSKALKLRTHELSSEIIEP